MIEDILQEVEGRSGVWPFDEVSELVEGRIPLISLFVQERDASTMPYFIQMNQEDQKYTHTSGARSARVAVCGSLRDLPRRAKGTFVSPDH